MKYYYTDPLKAAWMEREFGVKYERMEWGDSMIEIVPCGNLSAEDSTEIRVYIHPDCHGDLKPQVGDVTQDDRKRVAYIINEEHLEFNSLDGIIQRNGKAFFMPEVEND